MGRVWTLLYPRYDQSTHVLYRMTFDEWLAKNPVPAKWLRRLEQDEEETGLITAADSEDPDYDLQHLAATTNKRSRE